MKELEKKVAQFLSTHYQRGRPLLLGYSGGADSKALLYALLANKEAYGLNLHLAHVDHRMRPSSQAEARNLESEAKNLGLTFHLMTIETIDPSASNLEALYRSRRLSFFKNLVEEIEAQALLLGHHCQDLEETAIKRIFEGARLFHLSALRQVSQIEGISLWRPLLGVPKKELQLYLIERAQEWIEDETNQSPHYLRGRMRTSLFPSIEEGFGKKIGKPLRQIAHEAGELNDYLNQKLTPLWESIKRGPFGECLSLKGLHPIELRWILTRFGLKSFEELSLAIEIIQKELPNRWVGSLFFDRGMLFRLTKMPPFSYNGRLEERKIEQVGWRVEIKRGEWGGQLGWQGLFNGHLTLHLPTGKEIFFGIGQPKKWNDFKIPQVLRSLMPTLYIDGKPYFKWLHSDKAPAVWTLIYERVP